MFTLTFSLIAQAQTTGKSADATVSKPVSADAQSAIIKSTDATNSVPNQAVAKPASPDITAAPVSLDSTNSAVPTPFDAGPKAKAQVALNKMNSLDVRKLKSIKWPEVDLLKGKNDQYKDIANIKDLKKVKSRLHQKCVDYVNAYSEHIRKELGDTSLGRQYDFQCDLYAIAIEDALDPLAEEIYNIPSDWLLRRLDSITLSLYVASTTAGPKRAAVAVDSNVKAAYETTLFGIMGMPINISLWITQVLLILTTVSSVVLVYLKIRE